MRARNCYEILGVAPDASNEEIRAVYRKEMAVIREREAFQKALSRENERDKILTIWASNTSSEKNARRREDLLRAYTVLCDEERRAKHDAALAKAAETHAIEYGAGPPVRQPFSGLVDSSGIAAEAGLHFGRLFERPSLLWGICISFLFSLILTMTVMTGMVAGETQTMLAFFLSNARPFPLSLLAISLLVSLALWYVMLFGVALALRLSLDAERSFDVNPTVLILCGAVFVAWIMGICTLFFVRHSAHIFAALNEDPDFMWPLFVMPLFVAAISVYKICMTRISVYLYGLFLFLIVPLGHLAFVMVLVSIFADGAGVADYVFGGLHRLGGIAWSVLFFGGYQWYIGKNLEL